jgi:uncharacterized protein (DUF111 family)
MSAFSGFSAASGFGLRFGLASAFARRPRFGLLLRGGFLGLLLALGLGASCSAFPSARALRLRLRRAAIGVQVEALEVPVDQAELLGRAFRDLVAGNGVERRRLLIALADQLLAVGRQVQSLCALHRLRSLVSRARRPGQLARRTGSLGFVEVDDHRGAVQRRVERDRVALEVVGVTVTVGATASRTLARKAAITELRVRRTGRPSLAPVPTRTRSVLPPRSAAA